MDSKVFKYVTDRFINLLNEEIIPWEQPWFKLHGDDRTHAWSHSTGKPYTLINQILLDKPGEYITWNQIQAEGGRVKEDRKKNYYPIYGYFKRSVDPEPADGDEPDDTPKPDGYERWAYRYYNVYHMDDVEGIEPRFTQQLPEPKPLEERIAAAESVLWDYLVASGVGIDFVEDAQPVYDPERDMVVLPLEEQFKSREYMYATAFHELTHSTGHPDRLNRFGLEGVPIRDRALEELTAEIGSAALLNWLGIENDKTIRNNKAYIQSWKEALEKDDKLIVRASGRARKAVNLIFGD